MILADTDQPEPRADGDRRERIWEIPASDKFAGRQIPDQDRAVHFRGAQITPVLADCRGRNPSQMLPVRVQFRARFGLPEANASIFPGTSQKPAVRTERRGLVAVKLPVGLLPQQIASRQIQHFDGSVAEVTRRQPCSIGRLRQQDEVILAERVALQNLTGLRIAADDLRPPA